MRRLFKARTFARWSRKAQVSDKALLKAITEMAATSEQLEHAVVERELVEMTDEEKSNPS